MEIRTLGKTKMKVSTIGFGAWAIGGGYRIEGNPIGYGQTEDFESIASLEAALDKGVTFFDTADAYGMGHSECLIGQVFQQRKSNAIIGTKVGNQRRDPFSLRKNFEREYMITACEASLRRLRRPVIDLYQVHDPEISILKSEGLWDVMKELKDYGKIRHIGASVNTVEEALELVNNERVDTLQINYSILNRPWEASALDVIAEKEIGVIVREPLANGLLTGKFSTETKFADDDHRSVRFPPSFLAEVIPIVERLKSIANAIGISLTELALQYVLSHPAVSCAIPGARKPEQVVANVAAGESKLERSVIEEIRTVTGQPHRV